jgi:uncharacterized protein YceK
MRPFYRNALPSTLRFPVALLLCALLAGCSNVGEDDSGLPEGGRYAYTAYDSDGTAVVKGTLALDLREVFTDERNRFLIEGTRDLEQIGPVAYADQHAGEGSVAGSIRKDGSVWINLNPEWNDSNITLNGDFEGRRLEGEWQYVGFAGPQQASGRFVAEKQ